MPWSFADLLESCIHTVPCTVNLLRCQSLMSPVWEGNSMKQWWPDFPEIWMTMTYPPNLDHKTIVIECLVHHALQHNLSVNNLAKLIQVERWICWISSLRSPQCCTPNCWWSGQSRFEHLSPFTFLEYRFLHDFVGGKMSNVRIGSCWISWTTPPATNIFQHRQFTIKQGKTSQTQLGDWPFLPSNHPTQRCSTSTLSCANNLSCSLHIRDISWLDLRRLNDTVNVPVAHAHQQELTLSRIQAVQIWPGFKPEKTVQRANASLLSVQTKGAWGFYSTCRNDGYTAGTYWSMGVYIIAYTDGARASNVAEVYKR